MTEQPLELWAGVECSVVRVHDRYVDQLVLTGHDKRIEDLDRLQELGVTAVRYPVLWERAPEWGFVDERLGRLRELGLRPIVGLVHHGSGPMHTSLVDESFVQGLADFAASVAERYPWITDFTPVNEPLTTARFSALYGHWYPHAGGAEPFVRALVVQCRAIRAAMKAIRRIVPAARLVQTEDLGTVFSTRRLAYQARFENQRRFATLDLLTGTLRRAPFALGYMLENGFDERTLQSFEEDPCAPDIIGLNHYVTSDRFLDERVQRYPPHTRGGNHREVYADVEAVRVRGAGIPGHRALLELLWRRYRIPLAITEVHLGCAPEEQIRWLYEAYNGALAARDLGVDVRAVTAWSVFGASDWDSLLTQPRGHYEPGLFDVRGGHVRPTALARVVRDLAQRGTSDHPMLAEPGWWRRRERLVYPSSGRMICAPAISERPVLVTGGRGTLGVAIAKTCAARGLVAVVLSRSELDITDPSVVSAALDRYRPWAVVNAAGYVRVDEAESEPGAAACMLANGEGARILAEACARRGIRFATFSTDLVFDGEKRVPYVESDAPRPINVYGASKLRAEELALATYPEAIIVRTSAFFGPWDQANFVHAALDALSAGETFHAMSDAIVSPTWVPDLAHAVLTLLVDGAAGVWHLSSGGAITWAELAKTAAKLARLPADRLVACTRAELNLPAKRPAYCALASERGALMRPLDEALALYVRQCWAAEALAAEPIRETG